LRRFVPEFIDVFLQSGASRQIQLSGQTLGLYAFISLTVIHPRQVIEFTVAFYLLSCT